MKNSDKGKKQLTDYSSELRNHDIKLNKSENKRKHIQGMIGESETRFKSLYSMVRLMCDNVPDLIWAKDLQKKFVFVNRAICEQLLNSKDTDEPVGKTDMFFADRERLSQPDNPSWHTFGEICTDSDSVVLENKTPQRFDEFGNVKGNFLFLDVYKAPFLDEEGNVIGIVGCGRDVTKEKRLIEEREKIKELLRKSEEKFRNIFENVAIGIYQATPEGRFLSINPAAAAVFGYESQKEFISSVTDINTQIYAYPEDCSKAFSLLTKQGFLKNYEVKCRHKNGNIVWVSLDIRVVRDEQGNILYYEGTSYDITERKGIEEELRKHREHLEELVDNRTLELKKTNEKLQQEIVERNRAQEMLRGILDAIRDHISILDEDYTIAWSNEIGKQLFGTDYIGKKCYAIYHGRTEQCENCTISRTFQDGQLYEHEKEVIDVKGRTLHLWCTTAVADRYPDGRAKTVLEITRDISKRKSAEIALKKSEEELQAKSRSLEEMNAALRVLLRQREEDKKDLEENILYNIKQLVMPCLENLKMNHLTESQRLNIDVLEMNLKEIVSPFLRKMSTHDLHFTPRELEIINLISTGKTTKEIATLLNVGKGAVDLHRGHIRKKLNLNNKKGNLQLYLSSLSK